MTPCGCSVTAPERATGCQHRRRAGSVFVSARTTTPPWCGREDGGKSRVEQRTCSHDGGVLKRGTVDPAAQATKEHLPSNRTGKRRGGPLDPRLLRYTRTTRGFLVLAVAIGGLTALLLIAQAWLIAHVVAGAFLDHQSLAKLRGALLALLAVVAGRSLLAWAAERT